MGATSRPKRQSDPLRWGLTMLAVAFGAVIFGYLIGILLHVLFSGMPSNGPMP